jgi:hypothetical protein
MIEQPVRPAFGEGCITELMPALVGLDDGPLPARFGAGCRVLLVLDGLGWEQLQERRDRLPTLGAFEGGPITTVAPSTTAAALTSIATALPPGEHGIIGYRMVVDGQVFNTLRWGTAERPDARLTIPPRMLQPYEPFLGHRPVLVTKAEFRRSGFTEAHLRGGRLVGYRTPAVLVHEVARLAREGEMAIYAYYEGVDKVAHEYGLGSEYEAELDFADRLVAALLDALPTGSSLMVTADHGQVDCGRDLTPIHPEVARSTELLSGEARFRWLHARPGARADLLAAASEYHSHHAWVRSLEQFLDEKWFGTGSLSDEVRSRLGDVALLPIESIGFDDPADTGPYELIGRHGSATTAEMYVPCLAATA